MCMGSFGALMRMHGDVLRSFGHGLSDRATGGILVSMRVLAIAALTAAALFAQPVDLVLRNGKIVTMNPAQPTAQAIAVRGGRITALGDDRAAASWIGPATKVIDLHGMLAIPGFIEGHGHFTGLG